MLKIIGSLHIDRMDKEQHSLDMSEPDRFACFERIIFDYCQMAPVFKRAETPKIEQQLLETCISLNLSAESIEERLATVKRMSRTEDVRAFILGVSLQPNDTLTVHAWSVTCKDLAQQRTDPRNEGATALIEIPSFSLLAKESSGARKGRLHRRIDCLREASVELFDVLEKGLGEYATVAVVSRIARVGQHLSVIMADPGDPEKFAQAANERRAQRRRQGDDLAR